MPQSQTIAISSHLAFGHAEMYSTLNILVEPKVLFFKYSKMLQLNGGNCSIVYGGGIALRFVLYLLTIDICQLCGVRQSYATPLDFLHLKN